MRRLAILLLLAATATAAHAADSVTVGSATANGSSVTVPVYVRDTSGTPLGMDQPSGSRIQSFSIKVTYAPASAVQSVTFTRAGITAGLTPTFESSPSTSSSVSLLATFQESTNPIPFTLNAGSPGNQVAKLTFQLSSSATPGTSISLTLDPSLTQLTDAGGSTKESSGNGNLTLNNGSINIAALNVSLSAGRSVPQNSSVAMGVFLSANASSNTVVTLSSSKPTVARVPNSVTVPAGSNAAEFTVTGLAQGTSTITATLGTSTATADVTVTPPAPVQCASPSVPTLTAPASATTGTAYGVSWDVVPGATEYVLEEANDAAFTAPTSQTLSTTRASFTHATPGALWYYRIRGRNHTGSCDVLSGYSDPVSVLIDALPPPPPPDYRVLAVVGSLAGSFGSQFRTSVQLYNPESVPVSGKIVFHASGASGAATDPSIAYALAPGKTLAYADLLPAMGVTSGIGSADVVADSGSPLPDALARVYNDGGAAGTTGLAEEAFAPSNAMQAGRKGALLAPADVQKFRLNIGVRTLENGATLAITVRDKDGAVVKTTTKSYGANQFTQISSAAMLDSYALTGGETITFQVTAGSAFVYGSTTDNTTNDPSVQFVRGN
jgi:hypothetical protein